MCPSGNQTEDIRVANTRVMRWANGGLDNETEDWVAREEPLEIRVKGESIVVTMRTPGHDKELAIGFLLAEGVITNSSDVLEIAYCQQGEASLHKNILNVFLSPEVEINLDRLKRNVYASSSCGLCGKASIESLQNIFEPLNKIETVISIDKILTLAQKLRAKQSTFDKTGGLHAAGMFDRNGELLVLREDIGRHNAVDKAIGKALLDGESFDSQFLLLSGRCGWDIVAKAARAGIGTIVSIGACSTLAAETARLLGMRIFSFMKSHSNVGIGLHSHIENNNP